METKIRWKSDSDERLKALVFTAHYDDELLSCGGFIMQNLETYDFDVVVVTHKADYWRNNFFKVCKKLGVSKAIPLNLPLWINLETKEKYMFKPEEVFDAIIDKEIHLHDYDLLLTHGDDGDIDFHVHHKLVCDIASSFPIEHRLHFSAFPRMNVGKQHQLYDWIKEREHWKEYIMKGFIPGELVNKATYVCKLNRKIVRKKRELMDLYMPNNKTYVCVDYPFELFKLGLVA
jgi:LmbE family N-acetylglucosaminyl deacetylase